MKCVIVAAGQGTRIRSLAASKPLAPVKGMPLIEHVVRGAAAGGATGFVVVTGYEAAGVEAFLGDLAGRTGIAIETVYNPDWQRPNGLSVLAAAPRLVDDFLLLMSDHLFDPQIVTRMLAAPRSNGMLILASDYGIDNPLIDLDDATKVATDGSGRILRIGKTLPAYDAIDTGIFLASPALLTAIGDAIEAGGSGSLSEGVQRLADAGHALTMDIGKLWWLDVDDAPAHALAERSLPDF